jgi:hypothetical protein
MYLTDRIVCTTISIHAVLPGLVLITDHQRRAGSPGIPQVA